MSSWKPSVLLCVTVRVVGSCRLNLVIAIWLALQFKLPAFKKWKGPCGIWEKVVPRSAWDRLYSPPEWDLGLLAGHMRTVEWFLEKMLHWQADRHGGSRVARVPLPVTRTVSSWEAIVGVLVSRGAWTAKRCRMGWRTPKSR